MANSRVPGPLGLILDSGVAPDAAPWPLGFECNAVHKDSPGPLGFNDWAEFVSVAVPSFAAIPLGGSRCAAELTLDQLCKVYKHQSRAKCSQFLPHINATVRKYNIRSCLRLAHFLAQVGHESGELTYTAEVLNKGVKESSVYDGYKGRGLIQVTWKRNYDTYGKSVGRDFSGERKIELEEPGWATDSAGWFWTSGSGADLNTLADNNDLLAISALINGAFNGFEHRRTLLSVAKEVLRLR